MLPKADLHIHTKHSDGKLTPAEAVELAREKKLSSISITDHDTYTGYFEARDEARKWDIEVIPGVEITSNMNELEAHILAYFFDPETAYLQNFLRRQKKARKDRIKGIIQTLNKNGIDVDYDEVWAEANGANIGRPHLATVLMQKGYVGNFKEAFIRYLSNKQLGTITNTYPDYREVIEIIKNVGGACILAHPGRMYTDPQIQQFVDAGIDGLECIHPSHNFKLQKKMSDFCERHALLKTGGSDTHAAKGAGHSQFGTITIASKHVDSMRRMTEQRKKIVDLKN
ncbi:MAG: PHP domain-containing protein [Balneolaceae bacterium]|nr:PHP domain-containing protein [Balneolaceae bacterium]